MGVIVAQLEQLEIGQGIKSQEIFGEEEKKDL
jgi:hypothetical protein